jgi:NAD(P)H dehydrogenase (quinone)
MKHAVIVGHPNPDSFNLGVAAAYCEAVRGRGHEPVLRDLYRMGFDPCLKAGEIPRPSGFEPSPDVQAERALLAEVDVFTFVYPLWFNAPPAMVKGYMDRVMGFGFGYGPIRGGGNAPLLAGRRMLSLTSSGAPAEWLQSQASWTAIRTLFDGHLASVCGLQVLDHIHFGDIAPGMPKAAVEGELARVGEAVRRLF